MITRLFFENYRAFQKLDIPLTKINLFFGPNNSGKSAIISAINLLSQTIDSADRDVPLLLNGKFENLGTYKSVVYKNDEERDITLGLEFDVDPLEIEDMEPSVHNARIDVTFHYRKQRRETVVRTVSLSAPAGETFLSTRIAKTSSSQLIDHVSSKYVGVKTGPSSSGTVKLDHFLPSLEPIHLERRWLRRFSARYRPYRQMDYFLYWFSRSLKNHLGKIEFIGPFRRNPERIYIFSGEAPSSVGVHGEKAIDILAADKSRRYGKKLNIAERISDWLKKAEIAKEFELIPLTDQHFEVWVTHFDTGESENLADVGYGCSQILPILVAGYHLPAKNILIIQQPEIHLHPKAEAEVGTFICEVAKRDMQLFVETHSEHLILRLQSHVASGELSPADVNVFYIYPDSKSRCKQYHKIPLGQDGFFIEDWPRGFFPERLKEAKRLAKFSV